LWDTTQNTETSQKKQAKVCGQTKITNVALSPSQGEAPTLHPTPILSPCQSIYQQFKNNGWREGNGNERLGNGSLRDGRLGNGGRNSLAMDGLTAP
jgi:hypothetical protein